MRTYRRYRQWEINRITRRNEELNDLLEDLLTQIQEIREEFTSALDNLEDMIIDT